MWNYYDFPKAAPRPQAAPGKERKKFGETWWGKKWVGILSSYEDDQRMARGRAYARADKVRKFSVHEGKISATVIGSSGNYKVNVAFKKHSEKNWQKTIQTIKNTPLLLGKLLNNEMPEELEKATGLKFIPASFTSDCSCPDYANPCKHIAAVFYTLADEIDHDPLRLLQIQGMSRDTLFSKLGMGDTIQGQEKVGEKVDKKRPKLKKQSSRNKMKGGKRK